MFCEAVFTWSLHALSGGGWDLKQGSCLARTPAKFFSLPPSFAVVAKFAWGNIGMVEGTLVPRPEDASVGLGAKYMYLLVQVVVAKVLPFQKRYSTLCPTKRSYGLSADVSSSNPTFPLADLPTAINDGCRQGAILHSQMSHPRTMCQPPPLSRKMMVR